MPPTPVELLSRRAALRRGLGAILACGVAPRILPAALFGAAAPSNRITIGLIGNGLICNSHIASLAPRDDCRIVAVCDVWRRQAEAARGRIEKLYAADTAGGTWRGVDLYARHEELLARPDLEAVFVTTPDHWHTPIARAAMLAGKDVYCEKPATLTVREGRLLVETARRHGRVFQTGSQQRSNAAFRRAAEFVRNGFIGDLTRIRTRLGEFPAPPALPVQPIPPDLDYDRWLGPTPWRPYHARRIAGDYAGGWRCFTEYGARKNGDWGAHHFDIIQWALDADASGPVEFVPRGFDGAPYQSHRYASGVRVERFEDGLKSMIEFTGTKGTIWVSRGNEFATEPASLAERRVRSDEIRLYASDSHHSDFFDCIRHRQRPICDVEIGHRTATICHLSTIAGQLGRAIRWDPVREEIVSDPMAASLLDRPRRAPYVLA